MQGNKKNDLHIHLLYIIIELSQIHLAKENCDKIDMFDGFLKLHSHLWSAVRIERPNVQHSKRSICINWNLKNNLLAFSFIKH